MADRNGVVLIASTSDLVRQLLARALKHQGFVTRQVFNSYQCESALQNHGNRGVLLIDEDLLENPTADWRELFVRGDPVVPVVLSLVGSSDPGIRELVASRDGALLEEPFDLEAVMQAVGDALGWRRRLERGGEEARMPSSG